MEWEALGFFLSAVTICGTVVHAIYTFTLERQAERDRRLGKLLTDQRDMYSRILAYGEAAKHGNHKFYEEYGEATRREFVRLITTHAPDWVKSEMESPTYKDAQKWEVGKAQSKAYTNRLVKAALESDGSEVQIDSYFLARNMHTCSHLPEEYHEEISALHCYKAWFAFLRTTQQVSNSIIKETILENLHLFDDNPFNDNMVYLQAIRPSTVIREQRKVDVMNPAVQDFLEYTVSYDQFVKLWDMSDFTRLIPPRGFPKSFTEYIKKSFEQKTQQLNEFDRYMLRRHQRFFTSLFGCFRCFCTPQNQKSGKISTIL